MKAQTGSRIKKFTTLAELEDVRSSGKRIPTMYVLNETEGTNEGNVIVSIPRPNGNGADLARVPKTFIPIDLALQLNPDRLLDASEFRQTINKGLLKLVTREYAGMLLAEPDSKEEMKRLEQERNKAKNALAKAGVIENTEDKEDEEDDGYVDVVDVKKEVAKHAAKKKVTKGPSVKVEALITTAKAENTNATELVAKLRNIRKMTKADLSYVSKQYPNSPKVIKYLKGRLAELQAEAA